MFGDRFPRRQSLPYEAKQAGARLLRAVDRARREYFTRTGPTTPGGSTLNGPSTGSYIDRLPLELILQIFSYADPRDVVALRRVCSGFNTLISAHETTLTNTLLQQHPDLILLSELFPAPLPVIDNIRRPNLLYAHTLYKRNRLCSQLAYHLALRSVPPLFAGQRPPSAGEPVFGKRRFPDHIQLAVDTIHAALKHQLYPVLRFLSYTHLRFEATLAMNAAESGGAFLHPSEVLAATHRGVQQVLVQEMDDAMLIATHHAMTFLVNSLRIAISPDPPHNGNDDTVATMLRCKSPLERCVQFFEADKDRAPGKLRRTFMQEMQGEREELEVKLEVRKMVEWRPRIGEVWFEVAKEELRKRGLESHRCDGVFMFPGAQQELVVGCPNCAEVER